jgi:hypothetical protein
VASQPPGVLADPVHDLLRSAQDTSATNQDELQHLGSFRPSTFSPLATLHRIHAGVRTGDPNTPRRL